MLKSDKANLRWLVRNEPHRSDEYMASVCDCTVGTVKKYRKACAPREADRG